jgi:hypothetical protein
MSVCHQANAQVTWPGTWNSLGYVDRLNDRTNPPKTAVTAPSSPEINIVGDATYSGAFWAQDTANVYFRIRVEGNPVGSAWVWQTYLDTDADDAIDYVAEFDNTAGAKQVLISSTDGSQDSTNWTTLNNGFIVTAGASETPAGSADPTVPGSLARFVDADPNDSTSFPDAYFVDFALPWEKFTEQTGLTGTTPVRIAFATSQQTSNTNKDAPDTANWTGPIDFEAVPEPSSFVALTGLSVIGLAVFGWRRLRPRRVPTE